MLDNNPKYPDEYSNSYLGKKKGIMDIFSCHFNLFGQCVFSPRIEYLRLFSGQRECVLHVTVLRSLFQVILLIGKLAVSH